MENENRITFVNEDEPAVEETVVKETVQADAKPVTPDGLNAWLPALLKWGTPLCGVFCGVVGAIVAVLIMCIGFWQTLFVAVLAAVGAFVGAVPNKVKWIRDTINRLFPPKNQE